MSLWLGIGAGASASLGLPAELEGVVARFDPMDGPATLQAEALARHQIKLLIDPKTEHRPLAIVVELPQTGRNAWPAPDVEVRDSQGNAVSVKRDGIQWHTLTIKAPAAPATYLVQAIEPTRERPQPPAERERKIADPATGLGLTIARWHDGRRAALSIRFDDSHPTHLAKAIPMLRERGLRGTFMINPGGAEPGRRAQSSFQAQRAEWEACARRGDQEFANHTLHHRGARGDEAMEREIGDAARAIWALCPGKSKLLALNLGGGTQWETTRPLCFYLEKYHLFDASGNSTGMDDVYGDRVDTFRRMLEQHIARGLWFRIHYHGIGEGQASSEANFRTVLDLAKERANEVWIAGMADITKYQSERAEAKLAVVNSSARRLTFKLSCSLNPELYDQALTVEAALPNSWPPNQVTVKNEEGKSVPVRVDRTASPIRLRFDAAPYDSTYTVEKMP